MSVAAERHPAAVDGACAPAVAVVVSTYENPGGLESSLLGLCRQSTAPARVVVADDGSGPATAEVVARFAERLPLEHVWQPDEGFRLAAIRNRAVARCTEDYLVFLDGDTIPHHRFLEDHTAAAIPGRVVLAQRCGLLGYHGALVRRQPGIAKLATLFALGRVINDSMALEVTFRNRIRGLRKGIRLPRPVFRPASEWQVHGGNLALWREDLLAVNGFDERYVEWGREDADFVRRLERIGREPYLLLYQAVCFHLDSDRYRFREPEAPERARERRPYCERGIDQYLA